MGFYDSTFCRTECLGQRVHSHYQALIRSDGALLALMSWLILFDRSTSLVGFGKMVSVLEVGNVFKS